MGMSIDEAIIQSRIQLTIWEEGCETKLDNSPKAIETLIEIARKYQKIEKILSDWINDDSVGMSDYWMGRIKEVMGDGKVD